MNDTTTGRGPGAPRIYDDRMDTRFTVRVPDGREAAYRAAAARAGLKFPEWVRRALDAAALGDDPRKSAP